MQKICESNCALNSQESQRIIENYDPNRPHNIIISQNTQELLKKASETYWTEFDGKTWYGRCIFLSWYCSLADCTFCFRATKKCEDPKKALRSRASVALEALFCKKFAWRIEFLTGGYGMMPFNDLVEYAKLVSKVYGEKVWLNVGVLGEKQIEIIEPYIKGICASIETCSTKLHDAVCPHKPIEPYQKMFDILTKKFPHIKKSIAIIVGLAPQTIVDGKSASEDPDDLYNFIEKNALDRITMYALKPVRGTPYTIPPTTEEFASAIANVRIRFPKLQIIAGTNLRRCHEVDILMQAGANAITKFPATKQFATKRAIDVTQKITSQTRNFISNLAALQKIDWHAEINALSVDEHLKTQMKEKLPHYLHRFEHPSDIESPSACFDE